ncbi:alpha-L-fucosidase [Streptomyces sp. NPDC019890]|uniref:alpha-L-fucosidase n=1 Tax=Streptomyces sp. NPDC019890 TaxID=3365064 RepID=UPI00384B66E5
MRARRVWPVTALVVGLLFGSTNVASAAPNPVVPISPTDTNAQIIAKAATVTPSDRQLAWQREELTGFVHFGPNTYTGNEWGTGLEDPNLLQPSNLDTDQWISTFKNAGFKKVILVAKHHDGMLMFPSAYSDHGVERSSWLGGKGDIVRSLTDSARRQGVKVGIYLSPSDLHEYKRPGGTFGNGSPKADATIPTAGSGGDPTFQVKADDYNRYYMNTLYEILTKYGQLDELWFDGADPTEGKQPYNFNDWFKMVRTLQPSAVMFNGPDIRWVGNEDGFARDSEWSVVPQKGSPAPDGERHSTFGEMADNIAGDDKLTTESDYLAWHPAECDARLQPDWFWHEGQGPKSLDRLMQMYFESVGRNCQLLLNIAPDRSGRFPAAEVARMAEFGGKIRSTFATNLAAGATAADDGGTSHTPGNDPARVLDGDDGTAWQPAKTTGGLVLDLGSAKTFNTVLLQENIQVGQRVSGFAVDAWNGSSWQQVTSATTIGYKRLLKLGTPVTTQKVRLRITGSRALPPAIANLRLYGDGPNLAYGKPAVQSSAFADQPGKGGAELAVDGNTNGAYGTGSVTHTNPEQHAWWRVDLGESRDIGEIALWNRTDCCADRLSDYWVFTSETPFDTGLTPTQQAAKPGVWSSHQTSRAGSPTRIEVGKKARHVMVQLSGSNPLSLAEVQVFGAQSGRIVGVGGKCVDVAGAGTADGTKVQLYSCNGTAAQTWSRSGQTWRALGKCLDVAGAGTADLTKVQLYSCNGTAAQSWVAGTGGSLVNPNSGKCLDAKDNSSADGTQLIIYACHGGANQTWTYP